MNFSISALYQLFIQTSGISTDTRKIFPDSLFFALKGANFNGNEFALQALQSGAKYVVVDELFFNEFQYEQYAPQIFQVDDVLKTLQKLANYHRRQFQIPFIAICGSNGKTTTKELIKNVLSTQFRTFATQGNLNNHIGVPLTLLSIPNETEMAIIEIGANHEKETAELCLIAEPTYGLITNIGLDHLEGFGSIEGVARANGELFEFLAKHDGKAFVNQDDTTVLRLANQFLRDYIAYSASGEESYYSAKLLESDFFVRFESEDHQIIDTQLFGDYNFQNILAALCIGKYFGVLSDKANEAVASYQPSNHRSQIIQKDTNTVLMDCYNANPSSMQVAIENFGKIKANQKMVILGDMFELGEVSTEEHRRIGELVASYSFDWVVLFGEAMQVALEFNPKAYYFTDKFSLHNWLQDKQLQNTYILIKGSRGVALETALRFI